MPRTNRLRNRENINRGLRKVILWIPDAIGRLDEDSYDQSPAIFGSQDPANETDLGPALIIGADGSVWTMALNGTPRQVIGASGGIDLNGLADGLVLDADGDTSISADTDDQINFELGGVDHLVLKGAPTADQHVLELEDADAAKLLSVVNATRWGMLADSLPGFRAAVRDMKPVVKSATQA